LKKKPVTNLKIYKLRLKNLEKARAKLKLRRRRK